MTSRKALKVEAMESVIFRGHVVGGWEDMERSSLADCLFCDAYVQVMPRPQPNEINIGGTAVALECQREVLS